MPTRLAKIIALVSLPAFSACNSSVYERVVWVNPPDASLYINGEAVGTRRQATARVQLRSG